MENQKTEAEAIAELSSTPRIETVEGVPHLLLPKGNGDWTYYELSALLEAPKRRTGTVTLHEVDSFIFMVKRHGDPRSLIYVDADFAQNKVQATATFNDHAPGEPGWQDHKAVFSPRLTEEWTRWTRKNKYLFSQVELAHFLEENIADIAGGDGSPSGSDVLTFVTSLEETRKVKYGSAVNLQNGMVQIEFIEEGGDGQRGKLEMFREFAIGVSPFFNGAPYRMVAFLRYRIDRNTGEIRFWYELQRSDKVLEDACKEVIKQIKDGTGLPVIYGTAP